MFQIRSLIFPVICDLRSKTKGAAVMEFYFTFTNIILPQTSALILETNFTSNL